MPRTHGAAAFVVAVLAGSLLAGCGSLVVPAAPIRYRPAWPPGLHQLTVTSADVTSGAFPRELTCVTAPVGDRRILLAASPPAPSQSPLRCSSTETRLGQLRTTGWHLATAAVVAALLLPPSAAIEGKNDAGRSATPGRAPAGPPHHYHVMVFSRIGLGLGHDGAGLTSGHSRQPSRLGGGVNRGPCWRGEPRRPTAAPAQVQLHPLEGQHRPDFRNDCPRSFSAASL